MHERLTTRINGSAPYENLKRAVDQTAPPRQEGWLARWLE
jgi:hypothetical protein